MEPMASYYVNKNAQANGDHEVHEEGCSFMPDVHNRTYLGEYNSCHPAVAAAKMTMPFNRVNGCYYCCNECHTT